jgi:hypothetical protein
MNKWKIYFLTDADQDVIKNLIEVFDQDFIKKKARLVVIKGNKEKILGDAREQIHNADAVIFDIIIKDPHYPKKNLLGLEYICENLWNERRLQDKVLAVLSRWRGPHDPDVARLCAKYRISEDLIESSVRDQGRPLILRILEKLEKRKPKISDK